MTLNQFYLVDYKLFCYIVTKDEEGEIGYTSDSPLNDVMHPARPRADFKSAPIIKKDVTKEEKKPIEPTKQEKKENNKDELHKKDDTKSESPKPEDVKSEKSKDEHIKKTEEQKKDSDKKDEKKTTGE